MTDEMSHERRTAAFGTEACCCCCCCSVLRSRHLMNERNERVGMPQHTTTRKRNATHSHHQLPRLRRHHRIDFCDIDAKRQRKHIHETLTSWTRHRSHPCPSLNKHDSEAMRDNNDAHFA